MSIWLLSLLVIPSLPPMQASSQAPTADPTPKEFGLVQWQRRLEPALAQSAKDHKPVLLFFQEVPG